MFDYLYWVWYSLRCGAGSSWGVKLLDSFPGGALEIFGREFDAAEKIDGIPGKLLTRLNDKDLDLARRVIETCMNKNIRIIPCDSEDYPEKLKRIPDFPIVLYARGNIENLNERLSVAVVGTRKMTDYGKHSTFEIVRQLCPYNTVIVSGAAYGIDSAANRTALFFGASTIAVLGSGVDVPYPAENADLIYEIANRGLLLSEYIPGTHPNGSNFPTRNRIISGLSDAVLVAEAPYKSGALITASLSADQGRKVYAIPGGIFNVNCAGTNHLIQSGAKLCLCAGDILSDFAGTYKLDIDKDMLVSERYRRYEHGKNTVPKLPDLESVQFPGKAEAPSSDSSDKNDENNLKVESSDEKIVQASESDVEKRQKIYEGLTEQERIVFDAMPDGYAVSADNLVSTGLSTADIMSTLTLLELCSAVESIAGGLFKKII